MEHKIPGAAIFVDDNFINHFSQLAGRQ